MFTKFRSPTVIVLLSALCTAALLTGCKSTTTITEYAPNTGEPIKVTQTKANIVDQIVASTKDKSVFIFREQYLVGLRAEPDSETMFSLRCLYEHSNTGIASIRTEHKDNATLTGIATVMAVMKRTDSVSVSANGISSGSGSSSVTSSGASGSSSKTEGTSSTVPTASTTASTTTASTTSTGTTSTTGTTAATDTTATKSK